MTNYMQNYANAKKEAKGTDQNTNRPIQCLPTTWKIASGIIANMISIQLQCNRLLVTKQKVVISGSRGTKELLKNKAVCSGSKKRRTILAMA